MIPWRQSRWEFGLLRYRGTAFICGVGLGDAERYEVVDMMWMWVWWWASNVNCQRDRYSYGFWAQFLFWVWSCDGKKWKEGDEHILSFNDQGSLELRCALAQRPVKRPIFTPSILWAFGTYGNGKDQHLFIYNLIQYRRHISTEYEKLWQEEHKNISSRVTDLKFENAMRYVNSSITWLSHVIVQFVQQATDGTLSRGVQRILILILISILFLSMIIREREQTDWRPIEKLVRSF